MPRAAAASREIIPGLRPSHRSEPEQARAPPSASPMSSPQWGRWIPSTVPIPHCGSRPTAPPAPHLEALKPDASVLSLTLAAIAEQW